MNEALLRAIITIVSGALAGGLTNTVAIWMLFHPYRPPKFLGARIRFLQGAVPKNQARLAAAIGGAVGNRLLTEEDLTHVLSAPEFREAFDTGLSRFMNEVLEVERGSVRELLGPEAMAEAEPIIEDVLDHTIARIESLPFSRVTSTSSAATPGSAASTVSPSADSNTSRGSVWPRAGEAATVARSSNHAGASSKARRMNCRMSWNGSRTATLRGTMVVRGMTVGSFPKNRCLRGRDLRPSQ